MAAYDAQDGQRTVASRVVTSSPTGRHRSSGRTAQRTEIVTTGSKKVRSDDTNGNLLWELSGVTVHSRGHAD